MNKNDECRFGDNRYCETHVQFDPAGGGYKAGADPALCHTAAIVLQRRVEDAEHYHREAGKHVVGLKARIRELEDEKLQAQKKETQYETTCST